MKVLAITGTSRPIGNVSNIVQELRDQFEREGIEFEQVHLYEYEFMNCNSCYTCEIRGDCRCQDEDDGLNDIIGKMVAADGILMASPTFSGSCPGKMQTFMERAYLVMTKGGLPLRGKVGGAFAVCSQWGATETYNHMVDFMLANGMCVCGGFPMPVVRALNSPQYEDDKAGMKGIHDMADNMIRTLMRIHGYE